jgi:hypothetical protein
LGKGLHVPSWPGSAHDVQVVHDAVPQQTDSTQLLLAQVAPVLHGAPSGDRVVVLVLLVLVLLVLVLLVLVLVLLVVVLLVVVAPPVPLLLVLLLAVPLLLVLPLLLLIDPPAPPAQVTRRSQSEESV